jgi:hypothetical protein
MTTLHSLHVMYNSNPQVEYPSLDTLTPRYATPACFLFSPGEPFIDWLPLRSAFKKRLGLLSHRNPPILIDDGVSSRSLLLLHLLRLLVVGLHLLLVEIREVLKWLRPDKRALKLDCHALDARRSVPAPVLRPRVGFAVDCEWFAVRDALQLDVRANSVDAHVVCAEEVVAQIQLAEPEGYGEAGEVRGLSGCAVEGDVEIGPFDGITSVFAIECSLSLSLLLGDFVQVDFLQTNPEGS